MRNGLPGLFDRDITRVIIADPVRRFGPKLTSDWCHHPKIDVELVAVITGAGDKQFRACCQSCGFYPAGDHIPHAMLTEKERADSRVVKINTPTPDGECERCHRFTKVERHHWAPVARFADAYLWPTSDLCQACHTRWHQVMNVSEA